MTGRGHASDVDFLHAIVALADSLDLQTVAEGIESHDEYANLRRVRCGGGRGSCSRARCRRPRSIASSSAAAPASPPEPAYGPPGVIATLSARLEKACAVVSLPSSTDAIGFVPRVAVVVENALMPSL